MHVISKSLRRVMITFMTCIATFFVTIPAASAVDSEPTIVLTSYGPFARAHNSSEEVAEKAKTMLEDAGVHVVYKNIPTDWSSFAANLENLVDTNKPDAVISLGEAAMVPAPKVELVGQNLRQGIDALGMAGQGPVEEGGPRERYAPDENRVAQEAVKKAGYTLYHSYNAGLYLCNAALYTNLGLREQGRVAHAAFIHVPKRDLGAPKIADDAKAVSEFVRNLL